jgi:hypothetical protein
LTSTGCGRCCARCWSIMGSQTFGAFAFAVGRQRRAEAGQRNLNPCRLGLVWLAGRGLRLAACGWWSREGFAATGQSRPLQRLARLPCGHSALGRDTGKVGHSSRGFFHCARIQSTLPARLLVSASLPNLPQPLSYLLPVQEACISAESNSNDRSHRARPAC